MFFIINVAEFTAQQKDKKKGSVYPYIVLNYSINEKHYLEHDKVHKPRISPNAIQMEVGNKKGCI